MASYRVPGIIDATLQADPDQFKQFFGYTPEEYVSKKLDTTAQVNPFVVWDLTNIEVGSWHALKATEFSGSDLVIAGLPNAIELHEIAQKLLAASGRVANFSSRIIPYCGAFALHGEFMMEPAIRVVRYRRRRSPRSAFRQLCRSEKYLDCQLMVGFSMCPHGYWAEHGWLVSPDGTVLETAGPNSHYFGVCVSRDAVEYVSQSSC